MKTSSTARTAPEFEHNSFVSGFSNIDLRAMPGDGAVFSVPSNLPANSAPVDYAATARLAGRVNAARIPQSEVDQYLRERAQLLDKKLEGTISKRELNRLEYIRCSIDRIDDDRFGANLDVLEEAVQLYENIGAQIERLTFDINNLSKRKNDK